MDDVLVANSRELCVEYRTLLQMTQVQFGALFNVSARTIMRIEKNQSGFIADNLHTLARLVYPRDAQRAATLARLGGSSLLELGIVAPPKPKPTPAPSPSPIVAAPPALPPLPARHLADSVLCAAADAVSATPESLRPALLAALIRMDEVSLTASELRAVLSAKAKP